MIYVKGFILLFARCSREAKKDKYSFFFWFGVLWGVGERTSPRKTKNYMFIYYQKYLKGYVEMGGGRKSVQGISFNIRVKGHGVDFKKRFII